MNCRSLLLDIALLRKFYGAFSEAIVFAPTADDGTEDNSLDQEIFTFPILVKLEKRSPNPH
ncbi:MAG: hypothetical protein MGF17_13250 [Trichodesmium sp. MAG_R04]|nr:hypothetical protein [Trichodesmium sp. MAG_R04]